MKNNVLQFRHPHQPTISRKRLHPPKRVGYPSSLSLVCDDGDLRVDPAHKVVDQVTPMVLPAAGEPMMYLDGKAVALDLGDCTATRTILRLNPSAARAWAGVLNELASLAEQQGDGHDDEGGG